ncbi:hypothetical protein TCE0_015f01672 [Talaromyces pinophilus]|uniref:Major facilitator superfamily (MFS) profile domain-containing protein n=1 Tax=Talaromyces pinophilus TaxID=128442 RepID=A0A6V8GYS7_TALPI|nr:hypothetical protein TCE0_015f01672 [Talaromyces pinophilus]
MKTFASKFGEQSPAVHGLLVSSILLCAALSSVFAGRLADRLGRPQAMALGASVFALGTGLEAAAIDLSMFAAGRVIEGIGYGLYFSTQTVYICEISPPRARGPLTSGPQFMTCLALVVGYFTSYGTVKIQGSLSWRLPYILITAMAMLYVLVNLVLLPQSPRWLIRRQEYGAAEKVWDELGVKLEDREVNDDLSSSNEEDGTMAVEGSSPPDQRARRHTSFRGLWARDVRKQTFLAVFLLGFLQLCGIDAVLYYAPQLFQQAGLQTQEASFLASGISAIVIVASSIPATLLADKWGRRISTLVGGVGLTALMALIGGLYAGHAVIPNAGPGRWVVIVSIYLFCIVQATTWSISIKVWAPEIQPQHTRAQAISLAYGFNWVCNFFVAFISPILLAKSAPSAYFLFGGCTAIATVVSFFYMVETKGQSLAEIERVFRNRSSIPIASSRGTPMLGLVRLGGGETKRS